MSKLTSLNALLVQEIKDLYNAGNQLITALPKMVKAASDPALQEAFTTHLEETKAHAERLEEVAKLLDITPKGKVCKAMQGLVEEGAGVIEEEGGNRGEGSGADFRRAEGRALRNIRLRLGSGFGGGAGPDGCGGGPPDNAGRGRSHRQDADRSGRKTHSTAILTEE